MGVAEKIYGLIPPAGQSAMLSLYGIYLARLRYGWRFKKELKDLQASEKLSSRELQKKQTQALQLLIKEALANVPYYAGLAKGGGDLSQITPETLQDHFPILTKTDVRNNVEAFYSTSGSLGKRVFISTSGSSGSPLKVMTTRESISRNYAFFERFLQAHGVRYRDKSATFAGRLIVPESQDGPPYWRFNMAQNTWLMSSYHLSPRNFDAYIQHLESVQPVFIDAYPSAIVSLARYINNGHVMHRIRPKVIVTSSETLTDEGRHEVEKAFGCPVADQYGNAEMTGFIAQCERGKYHVHPEYGLLELVDDEGKPVPPGTPGRMVWTGFVNPAMPLIRYEIGDSAIMSDEVCLCGRHFPVLREILGRTDDLIITPDGRQIGRLDPLFKGLDGIDEAQIIQRSIGAIELHVVYKPGASDKAEIIKALTSEMSKRLGAGVVVEIREVASIPRGRNGKFKSVVSLVSK